MERPGRGAFLFFEAVAVEFGLDLVEFFWGGGDVVNLFKKFVEFGVFEVHLFGAVGSRDVFAAEDEADVFDGFLFGEVGVESFVVVVGTDEDFGDVAGAVGGGDDFAVDVAGVVREAGAVIFNGFGHSFYFCGQEESLHGFVGAEHFGGFEVVSFVVDEVAEVVVSGDDVNHVEVNVF